MDKAQRTLTKNLEERIPIIFWSKVKKKHK